MKLNERQMAVVLDMREWMQPENRGTMLGGMWFPSDYLCVNVSRVMFAKYGDEGIAGMSAEEKSVHLSLRVAIRGSLNGYSTFEAYLANELKLSSDNIFDLEENARLGRLAWLDRIVETGVIA